MKTRHVKYTVEFDLQVASENSNITDKTYGVLEGLLEQAVKLQTFYFKTPPDTKAFAAKPLNLKISKEISAAAEQ